MVVPQLNPVFREFSKMLNEALLDLKNLDAELCSKVQYLYVRSRACYFEILPNFVLSKVMSNED